MSTHPKERFVPLTNARTRIGIRFSPDLEPYYPDLEEEEFDEEEYELEEFEEFEWEDEDEDEDSEDEDFDSDDE